MRVFWSLILVVVLVSCTTSEVMPTPTSTPTANGKVLGIIDVSLGEDTSNQANEFHSQALINPAKISLTATTTSTTTVSGGQKYLKVTFEFTNNTGATLNELTFFALSTPQSLGGTAFKNLKDANGIALNNRTLALDIKGIHGRLGDTITVDDANAHFQAFTATDITPVQNDVNALGLTGSYTVLPYGFVAQNAINPIGTTINRSIPDGEKGRVTFAVRYPDSTANSMTMNFVVAEFGKTRFTRDITETTGNVAARVNVFYPRPGPSLSPQAIPSGIELFFIGDFDPLDIPQAIRDVVETVTVEELLTTISELDCDSETTVDVALDENPSTAYFYFFAEANQVINVAHVVKHSGSTNGAISATVFDASGQELGSTRGEAEDPVASPFFRETGLIVLEQTGIFEIELDLSLFPGGNGGYVVGLGCIEAVDFLLPTTRKVSREIRTLGDKQILVFLPTASNVYLVELAHDTSSNLNARLDWFKTQRTVDLCAYGLSSISQAQPLATIVTTTTTREAGAKGEIAFSDCSILAIGADPNPSGLNNLNQSTGAFEVALEPIPQP